MKISSPSLAATVVVAVSCIAWTGGITLTLMEFLDLSSETGWFIAGCLGFSSIAAVTFILFEMKHAMEMPDDVEQLEYMNRLVPPPWCTPSAPPQAPVNPAPAFRTPG